MNDIAFIMKISTQSLHQRTNIVFTVLVHFVSMMDYFGLPSTKTFDLE